MDNAPATQQFQYDLVDKPTASKLQMLAQEIGFIDRMACFEIGARLKAARDELSEKGQRVGGQGFKEWVESETNYSRRAAYEMIQIHENLSGLFVRGRAQTDSALSNFNYASLRQMAAPSFPEEARGELIEAAKAGEKISEKMAKEAKEAVLRAKQEAEQARQEAEAAKREKAEQERRFREVEQQQRDAATRLEKAREEYRRQQQEIERLKSLPPKEVEAPVPSPYASWEQYTQAQKNLMEDAEQMMKKAQREQERAEKEIGRLRTQLIKERYEAEKERNERSAIEAQQIVLTSLRTSIAGFLRNNADNFMQLNPQYLQASDHEYLLRVEEHLREMADKIAAARGVSAEYAEFEVVNG